MPMLMEITMEQEMEALQLSIREHTLKKPLSAVTVKGGEQSMQS